MKKVVVYHPRPDIGEGIALVLEAEFNCVARWICTAEDLYKINKQFQPDLIIGDMPNPGLTPEWFRNLRAASPEQNPALIRMHDACARDEAVYADWVDGSMDFPFRPDKLVQTVERIFCRQKVPSPEDPSAPG